MKTKKIVPCALICLVLWPLVILAQAVDPSPLSADEQSQLRDLIIAQQNRVHSLFVRADLQSVENGKKFRGGFEWATNGEKVYRKRNWNTPVDQPVSNRWQLAVWNGQLLKTYDSEIDNGAVRSDYDPRDTAESKTYTEYAQLLGHITRGPLSDLLRDIPPEKWNVFWATPLKEVVFQSTDVDVAGTKRHSWTVDLERGGLIVRYEIAVRHQPGGTYEPRLTWTVSDAREVEKGLWLPIQAENTGDFSRPDRPLHSQKKMVIKDILINDPSIESYFEFQFPAGSLYYDHVQGKPQVAGFPKGQVGPALDKEIEVLRETLDKEKTRTPAPDDFEVADTLIGNQGTATPRDPGGVSNSPIGQASKKSLHPALWLLFGSILIVFVWAVSRQLRSLTGQRRD